MAELASGAVSSLLGVIRNEMALLGGVRGDVQFIQEEMESMSSFLVHLARMAPAGGEHDEQVRTWMNQVRVLAQDCNNCLDLYLYRGNPEIHRARGGVRRYLWWAPWYMQRLVAQHRAATQLRQLKERARDVGERRQRYDVHVPAANSPAPGKAEQSPPAAGPGSSLPLGGDVTGDDEEDGSGDQIIGMVVSAADHFGPRAFFQPHTLEDYVTGKLMEWANGIKACAEETQSIAFVAPNIDPADALAIAHENLIYSPERGICLGYHRILLVNLPAVHHDFLRLRPKEVIYYILREIQQLQDSKSQPQQQETSDWEVYRQKWAIYYQKKAALEKIKKRIKEMEVYHKLDKIKGDIIARPLKGDKILELLRRHYEQNMSMELLDLDVDILFQLTTEPW